MGLIVRRKIKKVFRRAIKQKLSEIKMKYKKKFIFLGVTPIIVASTGRSGSTMLFETIQSCLIANRFKLLSRNKKINKKLVKLAGCYMDRLEDVFHNASPVKKTHALFDSEKVANKAKYIFVYGSPFESALSVDEKYEDEGPMWLDEHLYHLESEGDISDLFKKDILRYEDQLKAWLRSESDQVLCVPYDKLWEKQAIISDFLGFEVILPNKKARKHKQINNDYDVQLFDRLESIYQNNIK